MTLDDDIRADLFTHVQSHIGMHSELGPSVMVAYVLVTEWQTPQGTNALHHTSATSGGRPLPRWRVLGYLMSRVADIFHGRE